MSLILDALKRAEHERSAILSSITEEAGTATPSPKPGPHRYWRLALGVVLIAIAGIAAWKFLPTNRSEIATPPAQPAAEKPTKKASARASAVATRPPKARPKVIPGTEGMASLDDVAEPERSDLPLARVSPEVLKAEAPQPGANTKRTETPATPVVEPNVEPEVEPEQPQTTKETAQAPPQLAQPARIRRFREMPPAFRADFPAITIEVHVHDANASKRWVMINGRRYKESEKLAVGPLIREISAEGVVFDYRGETFLYSLNRWPAGLD